MHKQKMTWSELLRIFLVAGSLALAFALTGCNSIPLPMGEACVAFVQNGRCTNLCYDMTKDFLPDGEIRSDARARRYPCTTEYFSRRVNFDPQSFANLKAYALKQKEYCEAR